MNQFHLEVGGARIPVQLRENARARRFILRFDKTGEGVTLTLPRRASQSRALAFIESQKGWIAERLARQPQRISFTHGAIIPYRGRNILIQLTGGARRLTRLMDNTLEVGGEAAHLSRRVTEWLKREARSEVTAASQRHAQTMGLKFSRICLRDTHSRWGSCTADGSLSYSWRLIFAPEHVLDYVCLHEVAHLRELNHGPRFWALVEAHCPDWETARDWLRSQGQHLHLIG